MQEIDRGIYYENSFSGVTLGALIFPHGTIIIDAPLRSEDTRAWRLALNALGGNSNRILVNLDAHPDRTLGARALECTVIAHQRTAQVFRSRPSIFKGQNAESGAEWETYDDAVGTRWVLPDITFTQQLFLNWGPSEVILEHHPGSAPGAIWAIVPKSKVVFVGDAVLSDQPPFLASADIPAWLETLDILRTSYQDYIIISGRGGPLASKAVNIQIQHLKAILKSLERLAKRNAPPEATEGLIHNLLAEINFPLHLEEQYTQRLSHGLFHYYSRYYRPSDPVPEP